MVSRIADDTISGKIAKTIFEALWNKEGEEDEIIEKRGLKQVTDTGAIEKLIDEIIAANPHKWLIIDPAKINCLAFLLVKR